jgi:hypothetical protein
MGFYDLERVFSKNCFLLTNFSTKNEFLKTQSTSTKKFLEIGPRRSIRNSKIEMDNVIYF